MSAGGIEPLTTLPRALLIKAKSGFGNRILAAVTGIVLARLNDRVPVIDWRDGIYIPSGVNIYPLLFEDPVGIDPGLYDAERDVAPPVWSGRLADQPLDLVREFHPRSHKSPFVYRLLSISLTRSDPPQRAGVFWSYLPKLGRLAGRLRRDPRFAGRSLDTITREMIEQHFRPIAAVTEAVDRLFAGRQRPVIGVHVRFTDRKAPLPTIERELRRLLARLPGAEIFLATDNAEVQAHFLAKFDRVFVIEKALAAGDASLHLDAANWDDPLLEAKNALIDMWALARCDWLIHSRHSTFSETAALIGAIPADRQIDVDRANPRVVLKRLFQSRA